MYHQQWGWTLVLFRDQLLVLEVTTLLPRIYIQDIPELPDIRRVTSVKLLGVTLTKRFSMEQHISEMISSSAWAHSSDLWNEGCRPTVFRAMALSKLLYESPSWWGFTNADQRNRLEGFLQKATKARFYLEGTLTFSELCRAADVALFNRTVTDVHHPLQDYLPPRLSRPYNMRPGELEFQLPDKQTGACVNLVLLTYLLTYKIQFTWETSLFAFFYLA